MPTNGIALENMVRQENSIDHSKIIAYRGKNIQFTTFICTI